MKSEPKWPEELKYYYSKLAYPENCVEAGNKIRTACITAFNSWLKEQKPIVLPEKPTGMFLEEHMGWDRYQEELLRLNPQIKRGEG